MKTYMNKHTPRFKCTNVRLSVLAYMDGCKEICQRQTEMEKARRPMFQQELEELRSKVR